MTRVLERKVTVEPAGWWALALSEAVTTDKPLAVRCGSVELVLFRNAGGEACALEDRCPHRRAPLSLGKIQPHGLQCGYHGWTFDGATGACTVIPNLHADERVPATYAATPYHLVETDGFVHVWVGAGEPDAAPRSAPNPRDGKEVIGTAVINMPHEEYKAVMLDGPEHLLSFCGVTITDFFFGDPRIVGGHLTLDRGAVWRGGLPPAFVRDHPLALRTRVPIVGGDSLIELLDADEEPLVTLSIESAPNKRSTTSLCWRGHVHARLSDRAPLRWRLARTCGQAAFQIVTQPAGAAIAGLLPGPSRHLQAARRETEPTALAAS